MKKLNKKGFTIVELVIVIAVIGILAGVLIPTFTIVVRKANESAAIQALDSARKEQMTVVDATDDDFANFDANTYYYYAVDKKGQTIAKLQGVYHFENGEWKQVKAESMDGYAQAYAIKKAANDAAWAASTYFDAEDNAITTEEAFNTAKTNGTAFIHVNYEDINGVKICKVSA